MSKKYEEEDRKLNAFLGLTRRLKEDPAWAYPNPPKKEMTPEEQEESDNRINSFIEGYRSGDLIDDFVNLKMGDQLLHTHMLEMTMIMARKKLNNVDKYLEMSNIVDQLKFIFYTQHNKE